MLTINPDLLGSGTLSVFLKFWLRTPFWGELQLMTCLANLGDLYVLVRKLELLFEGALQLHN